MKRAEATLKVGVVFVSDYPDGAMLMRGTINEVWRGSESGPQLSAICRKWGFFVLLVCLVVYLECW